MAEPPQALVVSGLLEHEADEVVRAFGSCGLEERRRVGGRGWAAALLSA